MSADTERGTMPSFNIICHTNPLTDEQGDRMVTYLSAYSPVVDGDGVVTLTIATQAKQNLALALAVSLVLMFDYVVIESVEAMTTEAYDATYGSDFGL